MSMPGAQLGQGRTPAGFEPSSARSTGHPSALSALPGRIALLFCNQAEIESKLRQMVFVGQKTTLKHKNLN